jgi:hypothetical protein
MSSCCRSRSFESAIISRSWSSSFVRTLSANRALLSAPRHAGALQGSDLRRGLTPRSCPSYGAPA